MARRLLLHQVNDLIARVLRVHRLKQRGNARNVRGRHRSAVGNRVAAHVEQQRRGRVNLVAGGRKINRRTVVREIRARQRQAGFYVVRLSNRTHLRDAVEHGGHADAALDVPALRRSRRVRRGTVINRRVVDAHPFVTGGRNDRQPLALRVLDGTGRGLQARRLLGIGRTPVDPRIHRIRVVHDVHAVAGRPHKRASHVLGVNEAIVVRSLNRHDGRLGGDAVDADVVVVRRDNAGDVRAVVELVAPAVEILRRHTVHRTLHRTLSIHAARQIRVRVLNARVNDGDRDRRALHGDRPGLARVHSFCTPVEDLFIRRIARALVAHGGQAARLSVVSRRVTGCGGISCRGIDVLLGDRGLVSRGLVIRGEGDSLVIEDPLGAGRADGVNRDACVLQCGGQVGRERGRGALSEEGADLGVRGQGRTLHRRDQADSSLQVGGTGTRDQVDRVVHLVIVRAGRRDQAVGGFVSAGGRGHRRRDAHGQGERGDDSDACGGAAHCSSAFGWDCVVQVCICGQHHHPRICR